MVSYDQKLNSPQTIINIPAQILCGNLMLLRGAESERKVRILREQKRESRTTDLLD